MTDLSLHLINLVLNREIQTSEEYGNQVTSLGTLK